MTYFSKCLKCTINDAQAIEAKKTLWTKDNQNAQFFKLNRKFKPFSVVYFVFNFFHPISGQIRIIAMENYPK